jgi:PBP1b-binding outer membrane lipoprotein LpoB
VRKRKRLTLLLIIALFLAVCAQEASAQKKRKSTPKTTAKPVNELKNLQEQYAAATQEYKNSLEKLQAIYTKNIKKAEDELAESQKLFAEGLISRTQVEEYERAVATEKDKLAETQRQMASADTQVAEMLLEAKAFEQMAKSLRMARGSLVRTSALIRYQGTGGWQLNDSWKVQKFFSETFSKPLPIAVFGQGPIHDRWRLDHRNAMDISLHPNGAEGQALMSFLQKNGIPFLAFREAIPGTATGPHIHIGRPSHRY